MKHIPVLSLFLLLAACSGPTNISEFSEEGFFNSGDIRLSYVLDFPGPGGPYPMVILGHGSGRQTKHDSRERAERLLERNFAVLRYDKRGVGDSGGEYSRAFSALPILAGDMVAAVQHIKDHTQVDDSRIGLMGASQAGWIIPIAATREPNVHFAIALSGPTITTHQANFFDEIADDKSLSFDDLSKLLHDFDPPSGDFDPRPYLDEIDIPVLWLYGAQDRIIPAKESVAILNELIREQGKPFRTKTYPEADHGLRISGKRIDYWPDLFMWYEEEVR